ncbi:MAG: PAS domain-containing protein [Proteobacteria bacterium]|nr:PAS domain-containing protein [Pseudomonadota bacterium]
MSTLRSPVLRALYDFWIDLRQGDGLPSRSDFAPTNLPARLLPHIAIADVIRNDERLDFGWRLIGTHTTANTGRDMTGRRFSDIYAGENHDDLVANYIWVVRNELPLRWYGNSQFVEREWMQLEVVGMPLANDGRTVDKLFLGAVYSSFPE